MAVQRFGRSEITVVCVETRHMQAVLKAQINKTDRNDARGMAQMMRVGVYRPVHVKRYAVRNCGCADPPENVSVEGGRHRERPARYFTQLGLKVGMVGKVRFEARLRSWSRTSPTWPSWSSHCSLSGGRYANRPSSCIAVC